MSPINYLHIVTLYMLAGANEVRQRSTQILFNFACFDDSHTHNRPTDRPTDRFPAKQRHDQCRLVKEQMTLLHPLSSTVISLACSIYWQRQDLTLSIAYRLWFIHVCWPRWVASPQTTKNYRSISIRLVTRFSDSYEKWL